MPFAAYMQLALYHPQLGYYASGGTRTGWNGDFVTSPELDPGFGQLWGRAFEEVWELCGAPARFDVIEIGPGEGGFAASVLESLSGACAAALQLRLIERVPQNEERQRRLLDRFANVSWHRSVAEAPATEAGCFFANEVLDNLPVHLVEARDGSLFEVCVTTDGRGLTTELRPPSNPELSRFLDRCGVELPDGHRFEVALAAESLVAHAATRFQRGAWIFIDYGEEAADAARRPKGTLVSYSSGGADDLSLSRPGEKDLTAHANWTSIRVAMTRARQIPIGPRPQREVLKNLGLDDLHTSLREEFARASSDGEGAVALKALSRRQALGALADPAGLGGFGVMAGIRGIPAPSFIVAEREETGPKAGLS